VLHLLLPKLSSFSPPSSLPGLLFLFGLVFLTLLLHSKVFFLLVVVVQVSSPSSSSSRFCCRCLVRAVL
jgi:hypothetical protein